MPFRKPVKDLKKAIFVPCYKRPEYTKACLEALKNAQRYDNTEFYLVDDCSQDETEALLRSYEIYGWQVKVNNQNRGLRREIIGFLNNVADNVDVIAKVDNDCRVPKNWLDNIVKILDEHQVDILSPNVYPSNAAAKYGKKSHLPYWEAEIVGGLWVMKTEILKGIVFSEYDTDGLRGAVAVLRQIKNEAEPRIGWVPNVIVQDVGHWSGAHPDHIKTKEHEEYSYQVGREIGWTS